MAGTADVDVLIVGAGISGIGMAAHLQDRLPGKRFAIVERHAELGGTWHIFRYPGIRSDSDMHTLGFAFAPWREEKSIADGPSILRYLHRIVDERGLGARIHFRHKVMSADFSTATAMWTVRMETPEGERVMTAHWLYMGAGYYDHDAGHRPDFPGEQAFTGTIVHPQFWPQQLDHAGKRIVIIGSGATAVTLLPSLAQSAAHVTMLQRTPTWYIVRPSRDALANRLRAILPERWAYAITRFKNVRLQNLLFKRARSSPDKVAAHLHEGIRKELGADVDLTPFTPPYGPWEQRLCLVPDGDMFAAIRSGKAEVVTGRIDRFTPTGIALEDGRELPADIIVTATGLKLAVAGKIAVSIDGQPVHWHDHYYYKGCMFSGIPNFTIVFGYLNASWTLKADIVSAYTCRLLARMDATGADMAVPELPPGGIAEAEAVFDFSSGYVQRALDQLPRNGSVAPWRLEQDYLGDRPLLLHGPIEDSVLAFRRVAATASAA